MRIKGWVLGVMIFATGCLDRPVGRVEPTTSNVFVDQLPKTRVDKIDLLFMVDNSTSMADKQEILQSAVPVLVTRLTSPICIDASGAPTGESSVAGACKAGVPEFTPIDDIHVGIVTSSLGSHGGIGECTDMSNGSTPNDQAHLLGTLRPTGSNADPKLVFDVSRTWNNTGFLAWDPNGKDLPPGTASPDVFKQNFQDMIAASGEHGCGYEASLEAWYRFLVDPEPPANVTLGANQQSVRGSVLVKNADGSTTCNGCDQELLAQRQAFLRPDSLVAIVMLSDENDCSIRDDGQGWLVASSIGSQKHLWRAAAVCESNPNDKCCRSCGLIESSPPAGCSALADDPVCKTTPRWDDGGDAQNLRCFDQMRRFGFDLLYPTARYVQALTQPTLTLQSDGKTQVPNPLFASAAGLIQRDASQIFLAAIVGVPWQDIADDASLHGTGLKYLTAQELTAEGRWSVLLGDPLASPPVAPSDPFMVESITARSGSNPITNDPIVPPTSMNPTASPINGHEQNIPLNDDLQYACTFPLTSPRQCSTASGNACDCTADGTVSVATTNSPLCQPTGGGAATDLQSYAKAYPGTRELEVLKGLNDQGIAASICPKVTLSSDPDSDPSYGYNPAVAAIIDRLKSALSGKCLPRAPETDPVTRQVLCQVVEAQQATNCNCHAPGRDDVDPQILPAVQRQLQLEGHCDTPGTPACSSLCTCEILQEAAAADVAACRTGQPAAAGATPGYCYVDDPSSLLLNNCPDTAKRKLQFVSPPDEPTPTPGAATFVACLGAPLSAAVPNAGN
jgi:hypothetical protein